MSESKIDYDTLLIMIRNSSTKEIGNYIERNNIPSAEISDFIYSGELGYSEIRKVMTALYYDSLYKSSVEKLNELNTGLKFGFVKITEIIDYLTNHREEVCSNIKMIEDQIFLLREKLDANLWEGYVDGVIYDFFKEVYNDQKSHLEDLKKYINILNNN